MAAEHHDAGAWGQLPGEGVPGPPLGTLTLGLEVREHWVIFRMVHRMVTDPPERRVHLLLLFFCQGRVSPAAQVRKQVGP